ncbi:MAG: lysostaphin resistance A-like protein, partial [Lachnospiraceae bacterium]
YDNSVLLLNLGRMCSMIAGMFTVFLMFRRETASWEGSRRLSVAAVGTLAVSMALGINILFSLLHVTELSESFAHVAGQQYLVPVWQGLLLFGVISPLAEELVFRGVIYNRLKRYFPVWIAILTSAFLFGGYHGNIVQGIYGFLMGTVIVWLYELTGNFRVPVVFHSLANISVFLITYDPDIAAAVNTWLNFLIFAIISILTLAVMRMRKKN